MVGEDLADQRVVALLELVDDGVVERILVLLQPVGDVVGHLRRPTTTTTTTTTIKSVSHDDDEVCVVPRARLTVPA